ncbi:hypothetical protein B0H66DRAFT_555919 [Apodospora peruviana]|uniref:Tail specific protease domain-containing protein n=1 Tax=Apodospora peruviana TaxID=516989 RepID=A0AAE0I3Z1_9PEZI|nr:hypothetical protein B0H66DRAFT_555919 [Apodospora peruviana]
MRGEILASAVAAVLLNGAVPVYAGPASGPGAEYPRPAPVSTNSTSAAISLSSSVTGSVLASVITSTPSPTGSAAAACAVVSSSWSVQKAESSPATPTVAATLAHECLNSIPLGKQAAIDLVDAIVPYMEWQSDAAYKADPPADYFYPGYDMFAALAQVKTNLQADKYANEWEFQQDLYVSVFGPAHDGHFVFYPDALTRVFEWRRQQALVSISEDGESLPVIKVYEDVLASPETASVVKLINGIDAATYLANTIYAASWNQDADAAYNSMFYSKANIAVGSSRGYFANGGRIRYIYQGANTTLTFENGTVFTMENLADVKGDMTGVVDGPSYYAKFCNPNGFKVPGATAAAAALPTLPGYPEPVITTNDSKVLGYYLSGEGFNDVAVIVLTSFASNSIAEYQATVQDFFAEATAAGKTKLVIDVQGNGGGYILQGYDFFRQLFPHIVQDGFSRFKESDSFLAIAKIVSDRVAGVNPYTSDSDALIDDYQSWFNWRYDLNLTDQPFVSFADKFSPHIYKSTKYTNLMRWNLNDNLTTTNDTYGFGIEIAGYGTLSNISQPFAAEDIILLYDGICASTCTLVAEMLRIQAGVKSVAFGGRPQAGKIQGVGGIKGAQVLQYSNVYGYAKRYLPDAQDDAQRAALSRFSQLPVNRSSSAALNVRDQILRDNVDDGLPAQFVREEADCRLYWTAGMVNDVTEVWKAAADAAFNGQPCNAGGISKSTPTSQRRKTVTAGVSRPVGERRSDVIKRMLRKGDKSAAERRADDDSDGWAAAFNQRAVP